MNQRSFALSLFDVDEHGASNVVALGPGAAAARTERNASSPSKDGSGDLTSGEDSMLGTLVWFSVSDAVRLTPDTLREAITEAGLEAAALMPQSRGGAAALSRASEAAEVRGARLYHDRHGAAIEKEMHANVLIRTAARGVKQIVTEILDAAERRLFYQPLATVKPTEDGGELEVKVICDGQLLAVERAVVEHLRGYFDFEKDRHDAEGVRRVIGRVLYSAAAVPLRNSGGMYFIPRQHDYASRRLLSFVDEVRERAEDAPARKARPSRAMSVPLVDRQEYREVVSESLEEYVEKEAKALVKEMSGLLKGEQAVTPRRGRGFIERVSKLKEDVEAYEELLQMRASEARASLELAFKEARALFARVGEG